MSLVLPLFPLNTVLFPGGPLRLRIFEPRYLDMVSRCMRESSDFGVALITEGREAGGTARTTSVGTTARIVDFERLDDGLLGITARGEKKFSIVEVKTQSDGLNLADVTFLPEEPVIEIPEDLGILAELLKQALAQLGTAYGDEPPHYENASWVGMRLAEILPLPMPERQQCLEMDNAVERLRLLRERLDIRQA
ncbi:LON peptidase substrate-binding domain-containing protein [Steroidobacter sp.]|uniref:LON peptidase substrate-binding domain-containing protein n=1 Tax=Steroidobacter sp. TaxID=1978227 RepID=UPI001A3C3530|nr:LON peptidase substrate-binding domain-containing protein [Steroidobacter sp.]MBL8270707.1 LON peptidase substrate-binding domain-containing protein [Steroidobacter sp.]